MVKKFQLICMSFDGEYQTEKPKFESIDDAWEYSNDLGSKWYFYPFHFVVVNKTIRSNPDHFLDYFLNKRIKTVSKIFNELYEYLKKDEYTPEEFIDGIIEYLEMMDYN